MFSVIPEHIRSAAYGVEIPEGDTVDEQLAWLIDKAEVRLAAAVPTLPARFADGTVEPLLVRGVIEDMVLRVVKNPRSLRSLGYDDFQATIDAAVSAGSLYVDPAERELLSPASTTPSVGTIRLNAPSWRFPGA